MSDNCGGCVSTACFAIVSDGDAALYVAPAVTDMLEAFARGPGAAIAFVEEQRLVELAGWLREDQTEAGAVIDRRCQALWLFVRFAVAEEVEQRRVYFDLLRSVWPEWEVRWAHRGVVDLAQFVGTPAAAALAPDDGVLSRAPRVAVSEVQTCCTWTVDGCVRIYSLEDAPVDVLACGPEALLNALSALPHDVRALVPLPKGGIHIDSTQRTLDFWLSTDAPSALERTRRRWPGWRVRDHRDRYARQEAAGALRFRTAPEREQIARLRHRLNGVFDAFTQLDQQAETAGDRLVVLSGPRAGERLAISDASVLSLQATGCWLVASRGEVSVDREVVKLPRLLLHGEVVRVGLHELEFRRAETTSTAPAEFDAAAWRALLGALLGDAPHALRSHLAALAGALAAGAALDACLDVLGAAVDEILHATIDSILHHPTLRALEARWRGLALLVERAELSENIELWLLPCSLVELRHDLSRSPDPQASGLARVLRANPPYFGAIVADYELSASAEDVALLACCAAIANEAAAPLLATIDDVDAALSSPAFRALRAHENARDIALVLPRFLLRGPHGALLSGVPYRERFPGIAALPWGNAVYLLATALAQSFAHNRSCRFLSGALSDLPRLSQWDDTLAPVATECQLSREREHQLARQGFVPLAQRSDLPEPCFTWVNSLHAGAVAEEGGFEAPRTRFDVHLGYRLYVTRMAQFVACVIRDAGVPVDDLESTAMHWLMKYVADGDVVSAAVRSRRPFRKGSVTIADGELYLALRLHVRHFLGRIELERRLVFGRVHG